MENEPPEVSKLQELANKLEAQNNKSLNGALKRFIDILRRGNVESAKAQIKNELFDKLTTEEEVLIIEALYNGSGSPWKSLEQELTIKK